MRPCSRTILEGLFGQKFCRSCFSNHLPLKNSTVKWFDYEHLSIALYIYKKEKFCLFLKNSMKRNCYTQREKMKNFPIFLTSTFLWQMVDVEKWWHISNFNKRVFYHIRKNDVTIKIFGKIWQDSARFKIYPRLWFVFIIEVFAIKISMTSTVQGRRHAFESTVASQPRDG